MPTSEQTMMTFAALSYADPATKIAAFLANPPAGSPAEGWDLAWGPAGTSVTQGNLVYAARAQAANQCAVVIRGTYPHPTLAFLEDLYQDLTVAALRPWPYPPATNAKIAKGTMDGLEDIQGLKDPASGLSLLDFLQQPALAGFDIYVTGHSLGGCLTTVLAPWLRSAVDPARKILPYTFAAPTAGNQAFAAMFTQKFPNALRYYNVLDVIPMAWSDLGKVKQLYPAPGPDCPLLLQGAVDGVNAQLALLKLDYEQPNGAGNALQGVPVATADFVKEVLSQHDHQYYLKLLGAPTIPNL
jgi:hypothetical protein